MAHLANEIVIFVLGAGLLGVLSWPAVGTIIAAMAFLVGREGKG